MGLDITAASKIDLSKALDENEVWPRKPGDPKTISLVKNPSFLDRCEDMPIGDYAYYVVRGDMLSFRAGSYGGYNEWRRELARMTGTTDRDVWNLASGEGVPFYELIHFSDCEGCIGPKVSAKLAKDFSDWQERAIAFALMMNASDGKWFIELYAEWRKAFDLASDGGAVMFH